MKYLIGTLSSIRDCVISTLYQVPVVMLILVWRPDPPTLLWTNTLEFWSIHTPASLSPISRMLYHWPPMVSALNSRETLYSFPNFGRVSSRLVEVGVISRNIYLTLLSKPERFTCGGSQLYQIKTGQVNFDQIQHCTSFTGLHYKLNDATACLSKGKILKYNWKIYL